jgi:hypothetical protein
MYLSLRDILAGRVGQRLSKAKIFGGGMVDCCRSCSIALVLNFSPEHGESPITAGISGEKMQPNSLSNKTRSQNKLALFKSDWKQFPSRPVSLLEIMRALNVLNIFYWDRLLDRLQDETKKVPAGTTLPVRNKKRICEFLDTIIGNRCRKLGWEEAEGWVGTLKMLLTVTKKHPLAKKPPTADAINNALFQLQNAIHIELGNRMFAMIESRKADFLEQKNLFGRQVSEAFPSAAADIKDAGNCLAVDLNTAAVFHLMRVVEHGLRALAVKLGVPIPNDELEYEDWNSIINQTYVKVKALTDSAQGTKKEKAELREFYNGVMQEFSGFKDVWRNAVMHTRRGYNEKEAAGVFERVRDFMQRLATKVSEST